MAEVYDWPPALRPGEGASYNLRGQVVAGPVSLAGRSQVTMIDTGYWVATLPIALLDAGNDIRVFRALRALLDGGGAHVRVPFFDAGQAPWPAAGGAAANAVGSVTFSDGATFSDGSGFFQAAITVELGADAAAGATEITVTVINAGTITGGEIFSLGERAHTIASVRSVSGSTQVWAIRPRLRKAHAAGEALDFDNPVCRMRPLSEQEMDLAFGRLWRAKPQVGFVEAFA